MVVVAPGTTGSVRARGLTLARQARPPDTNAHARRRRDVVPPNAGQGLGRALASTSAGDAWHCFLAGEREDEEDEDPARVGRALLGARWCESGRAPCPGACQSRVTCVARSLVCVRAQLRRCATLLSSPWRPRCSHDGSMMDPAAWRPAPQANPTSSSGRDAPCVAVGAPRPRPTASATVRMWVGRASCSCIEAGPSEGTMAQVAVWQARAPTCVPMGFAPLAREERGAPGTHMQWWRWRCVGSLVVHCPAVSYPSAATAGPFRATSHSSQRLVGLLPGATTHSRRSSSVAVGRCRTCFCEDSICCRMLSAWMSSCLRRIRQMPLRVHSHAPPTGRRSRHAQARERRLPCVAAARHAPPHMPRVRCCTQRGAAGACCTHHEVMPRNTKHFTPVFVACA
jgi:hypothetical protein